MINDQQMILLAILTVPDQGRSDDCQSTDTDKEALEEWKRFWQQFF